MKLTPIWVMDRGNTEEQRRGEQARGGTSRRRNRRMWREKEQATEGAIRRKIKQARGGASRYRRRNKQREEEQPIVGPKREQAGGRAGKTSSGLKGVQARGRGDGRHLN